MEEETRRVFKDKIDTEGLKNSKIFKRLVILKLPAFDYMAHSERNWQSFFLTNYFQL